MSRSARDAPSAAAVRPLRRGAAPLLAATAVGLVSGAAEAWVIAVRERPPALSLLAVAGVAQALALAAIVAVLLSWRLLQPGAHADGRRSPLTLTPDITIGDLVAAAGVVLPIAFALLWQVVLWHLRSFKNQELLALLIAAVGVFVSGLAGLLVVRLMRLATTARRRLGDGRRARVLPLLPGFAVTFSVAAWVLSAASPGLRQLDPALLGFSWLIGLTLAAFVWVRRSRTAPSWPMAVATAAGALMLGATAALLAPGAWESLARSGSWSRVAVRSLRVLSDLDGDGYSGLFGGGDCAPRDSKVHPGAREIPKDGVDNNCVHGDGGRWPWPRAKASAVRPPELARGLSFLLITIETLRADRVSFLGYSRATTPRLSQLAREAIVFERLYTPAPSTRLSLAALLSGIPPSRIAWKNQAQRKQMRRIGANTPWLPETLSGAGYTTLAVHTSFRAFTAAESAGFDRGFQHYDSSTPLVYSGGTMRGFPGQEQVDRALTLLDTHGRAPWFLWLHLVEPHYVYEQSPAVGSFGSDEQALYDAEIAEADRQVGRLVDGLSARGLLDETVLLVCGDHGEEFGEHGNRWHGSNLYDPQVRSAGLLRAKGLTPARFTAPVTLTDFAPTVLDVLGVNADWQRYEGRNLLPAFSGGDLPPTPLILESFKVDSGAEYQLALVDYPLKVIYSATSSTLRLYNLSIDPAERHDLYPANDSPSRALVERLYQTLESAPAWASSSRGSP